MFEAEIQKAVDDYAAMELKARAWDELLARVAAGHSVGTLADLYEILLYVHHAHITSKG